METTDIIIISVTLSIVIFLVALGSFINERVDYHSMKFSSSSRY